MTSVDENYTGHVEPGTAARRSLPGASIVKASVGPMDTAMTNPRALSPGSVSFPH
jgi:hypothetical protein